MTDPLLAKLQTEPISEVVINPPWAVLNVIFNGAQATVLRLEHPRLGMLTFVLPDHEVTNLGAVLSNTLAMRAAAPPVATPAATIN